MQNVLRQNSSSNALGIGVVALLHLGVAYLLITEFSPHFRAAKPHITDAVMLDEPKKIIEPVREQPFEVKPAEVPDVFIPTVEIKIDQPAKTAPIAKPTSEKPPIGEVAIAAPPGPSLAPARDTFAGSTPVGGPKLVYPAGAQARNQEGWVDVDCTVDAAGRTSQCAVVDHHGSPQFTDAALTYVSGARYSPATHNGQPVAEPHHRFHIEFKLSE
jgi:protein TonB